MSSPEASGPNPASPSWSGSLDVLPQAAFLLDAAGDLLDSNPACLELYGLSRQEFLGGGPVGIQADLVREDGSPYSQEDFPGTLALRTGHRVMGQVAGIWNPTTQQRVWLEVNAVPAFQPGETRPYRALVTLQDQTPQRQAAAELSCSEGRLRALTDNAPDHILQLDTLGRIQYVNHVLPGHRFANGVGQDWLDWMPEPFQAPARAAFERVLLTRKRADYEVQSPGDLRWYHCRLSPATEGETLAGMVLYSTDITRRRKPRRPCGTWSCGMRPSSPT